MRKEKVAGGERTVVSGAPMGECQGFPRQHMKHAQVKGSLTLKKKNSSIPKQHTVGIQKTVLSNSWAATKTNSPFEFDEMNQSYTTKLTHMSSVDLESKETKHSCPMCPEN